MIRLVRIDRNGSDCGRYRAIQSSNIKIAKSNLAACFLRCARSCPVPSTWTGLLQNRKTVLASRMRLSLSSSKAWSPFTPFETVGGVKVSKRELGPAPLAMLRGRHRRRFRVKCRRDVAPQGFIRDGIRGSKGPGDLHLPTAVDLDNSRYKSDS